MIQIEMGLFENLLGFVMDSFKGFSVCQYNGSAHCLEGKTKA